jgi:uncharacterized membrane protein YczE
MFLPLGGANVSKRLVQVTIGLTFFGVGIGLMLRSGLGLPPWDVLHQGLATRFGLTVGTWSILISVIVLLLWIPLRERYGVGTLLNAAIIGVAIDVTAALVPDAQNQLSAWLLLTGGILLIGFTSGMYIGANLGPGPRDGLMTAIARRGYTIRTTRLAIEAAVLLIGWLMGGTFGIGTVIFAVVIGPLVHFFLPRWTVDPGTLAATWDRPAR